MHVNWDDVGTYFSYLNRGREEIETLCVFDKEGYVRKGSGVIFREVSEIRALDMCDGDTLHSCLNLTDFKGRRRENIRSTRVLCVDIDSPVDRDVVKGWVRDYNIGMVVESSSGKYHLYWRWAENEHVSLQDWSGMQRALAWYFSDKYSVKSDFNLSDITKNIRVPGFERITKTGETFMPKILFCDEDNCISGWREYGQEWRNWEIKGSEKVWKERQEVRNAVKLAKVGVERGVLGNAAQKNIDVGYSGRNCYLYSVLCSRISSGDIGSHGQGLAEALSINARFNPALDKREIDSIVDSAWRRGRLRFESKTMGFGDVSEEVVSVDGGIADERGSNVGGVNVHVDVSTNDDGRDNVRDVGDDGVAGDASSAGSGPFKYDYSDSWMVNRFSEMALASRIIQRFGDRMVCVAGTVYAFNSRDGIWIPQSGPSQRELNEFYSACVLDILQDENFIEENCMNQDGEVSLDRLRKAQKGYLNVSKFSVVSAFVQQSNRIKVMGKEQFDALLDSFYCTNGVVDMLTGVVRKPVSQDYMYNRAAVAWNPQARCDGWLGFLSEIFKYNESVEEMIAYLQEIFGYTLSGYISEQKIFCHIGDGSNGKSKVLSALMRLVGDYGTILDPDELVKSKGKFVKNFERFGAKIESKRLAVVDDLDVNTEWNEGFVKGATAGRVRARGEYERSRDIVNRCKFHMGLNVMPLPEAENYGLLRRLALIPYERTFAPVSGESERIDQMIESELEGILVWAVEGFRRWKARGSLAVVGEIEKKLDEYKGNTFGLDGLLMELYGVTQVEVTGSNRWTRYCIIGRDGEPCDHIEAGERVSTGKKYMIITPTEVLGVVRDVIRSKQGLVMDARYQKLSEGGAGAITEDKVRAALRRCGYSEYKVKYGDKDYTRISYVVRLEEGYEEYRSIIEESEKKDRSIL